MGIVGGNCQVEIYIHLLDITATEVKNAEQKRKTLGPLQKLNLQFCDPGAVL
jgi:hypothetical protein